MKKPSNCFNLFSIFLLLILVFPTVSRSQNTYTVVCDKTNNTVKVVESNKRSPNYVPIKGGFPFRQVAQKWIDENYSTTECNPEDVLEEIQKQNQNVNVQKQQGTAVQQNQNNTSPATQPLKPAVQYRNTSFFTGFKMSNLGKVLNTENNMVAGAEIGLEQLFGNKFYFGAGILFNSYIALNVNKVQNENLVLYFGRIPLFIGHRIKSNNVTFMYETGVHVNTRIVSTEEDQYIPGLIGADNSVNFLGRIKIGSESVLFEMGSELWLTEIFEDENFDMTSIYGALRFYF